MARLKRLRELLGQPGMEFAIAVLISLFLLVGIYEMLS